MRREFELVQRGLSVLQDSGPRAVAQRAVRAAYRRMDSASLDFPIDLELVADSRRLSLPVPAARPERPRPLRVGFVTTPPSMFSGGHTTMFRMVAALESAGHRCTLFLYDRHGGDIRAHEAVIRKSWPWVRADVANVRDGLDGLDAAVATAWSTAHVLASCGTAPMRRFYLVQDYEPFFYPLGAEYALAEDTYRFGFRCIAIGHGLAGLLRERVGVESDVFEFGCDSEIYRLTNPEPRSGIVFYTKPGTARRGYLLGLLALQEVHRRRPEVPIHTVGDSNLRIALPVINHGSQAPAELARLYNSVATGIALSFTNVSLLAEELLACGVVPVVNDSLYDRGGLDHAQVRWVQPTPSGLADAILAVLDSPPDPRDVAGTARADAWLPGQQAFVRAVEAEVYGS